MADLVVRVGADLKEYHAKLNEVPETASRIAPLMVAAGATIGAAITGIGVASVKMAGDLQQSVANISTIKPEIDTSEVFHQLNEISTRVPQSADQLGDSLYNIFSSVEASQEQALKLTETFAKGAVGAQTDAATFGTSVLGAINAYGVELEAADHITDVFFNTVNKGVVTGAELAANLGVVTQSAKAAGVDIDELGGFVAGVTKEGGPAAQNINNLSNFFNKITTKEAQEQIKGLGVSMTDSTGKFKPLLQVMKELKPRLDALTPAARTLALQKIFPDLQARQGAQVILSQLDFVDAAIEENKTQVGSAERAYEKMSKTFNSQMALMKNQGMAVLTELGFVLLPHITGALGTASGAITDFRTRAAGFEKALGLDPLEATLRTFEQVISEKWGEERAAVFRNLSAAAAEPLGALRTGFQKSIDEGVDPWTAALDGAKNWVKDTFGPETAKAFEAMAEDVGKSLDKMTDRLPGWAGRFAQHLGFVGTETLQFIELSFGAYNRLNAIYEQTDRDFELFYQRTSGTVSKLGETIGNVFNSLGLTAGLVWDTVVRTFEGIVRSLEPFLGALRTARDLIAEIAKVRLTPPPPAAAEPTGNFVARPAGGGSTGGSWANTSDLVLGMVAAGTVPGYQHGGIVPGYPIGEAVLAVVHRGEEYAGVGRSLDAQGGGGTTNNVSINAQGATLDELRTELHRSIDRYMDIKGREASLAGASLSTAIGAGGRY